MHVISCLVSVYRELDDKDELLKQNRKLNKLTPIQII